MAKNMTRKGLALGAAASLVAAGFAGTPAYAAFATLDASFGTKGATQNGLLGQTFNMAATSDTTASAKFYVTGANAAELTVTARYVTDLTVSTGTTAYNATVNETDQTVGNDKAATIAPASWTTGNFAQMLWTLDSSVTATRTITITPFLDTVVADGKITAGEVSGTPVTLTFHKASEVTATTTLDAITVGGNISAKVVLDKSINMASIGGGVSVYFAKNGADEGVVQTAAYSSTSAGFTAKAGSSDGSGFTTGAANAVYSAQARLGGTAAANNSGTAAVLAAAAGSVASLDDLAVDKGTFYAASANSSSDVVRAGSGSVTVSTTAYDADSDPIAGQPVTFKIAETGANVDSAATISAGGKSLSGSAATAQDFSVTVTTDADGYAELVVSYAGLKDANQFTVTISATGATGASTVTNGSIQFTGQDSAAAAIVDVNKLGGANGDNPVHTTTVGGAIAVAYRIVDQFGQTPVGTFRLKVATAATGGTINSTLAVSGGSANLSINDNSDAATSYNATATLEKQNTNLTWSAVGSLQEVSAINVVSAIAAGTRVTVTETADSTATANQNALAAAALATVDARLSRTSVGLPTIGSNSILSGVVYGANGAAVAGATVTLSAPGLMFVTNAGTAASAHYSLGSTTIKTGSAGTWGDVAVLSTVSGKHTVTVTSGSGTTTTDVYFAPAAGNTGSKVTITAPAAVLPGSTLQVSAVVTDKFGNPVDTTLSSSTATVAVSYTGPGLIVGNLPTETDSTGKITFNVLLGNNDRGNISMTVTYRPAGAVTSTANKSATATVVVGTVASTATSVKRTGNTVAVRVTGANARIVLNGVRVASRSTAGVLTRTLTLRAGRNVIQLVVDGKVVRTVRYTR